MDALIMINLRPLNLSPRHELLISISPTLGPSQACTYALDDPVPPRSAPRRYDFSSMTWAPVETLSLFLLVPFTTFARRLSARTSPERGVLFSNTPPSEDEDEDDTSLCIRGPWRSRSRYGDWSRWTLDVWALGPWRWYHTNKRGWAVVWRKLLIDEWDSGTGFAAVASSSPSHPIFVSFSSHLPLHLHLHSCPFCFSIQPAHPPSSPRIPRIPSHRIPRIVSLAFLALHRTRLAQNTLSRLPTSLVQALLPAPSFAFQLQLPAAAVLPLLRSPRPVIIDFHLEWRRFRELPDSPHGNALDLDRGTAGAAPSFSPFSPLSSLVFNFALPKE
ncbi:hypothetical protein B0H12DRAFT_1232172 [Mycena haematopus]|nr:hypothetical protein B0H12DRAFT_1232172 [Mycena haematopus]